MMRLLFLDIDGVLINLKSFQPPLKVPGRPAEPHPECVKQLNRILDKTGAHLVVTSTWRKGRDCAEMRDLLASWGVCSPAEPMVLGLTPELIAKRGGIVVAVPRGHEIARWILDQDNLPTFRMAILDDEAVGMFSRVQIQTTFELGLTWRLAETAIDMLEVCEPFTQRSVSSLVDYACREQFSEVLS